MFAGCNNMIKNMIKDKAEGEAMNGGLILTLLDGE